MSDEVRYRDVPGHWGYRVGDDRTVWSCLVVVRKLVLGKTWKRLRSRRKGTGPRAQEWVTLSRNGVKCEVSLTRLIEEVFPPPGPPPTRAELLALETPPPGAT
jgi:hypothetical protein